MTLARALARAAIFAVVPAIVVIVAGLEWLQGDGPRHVTQALAWLFAITALISAVRARTASTIAARRVGSVTAANRQGCRFVAEGAVIAASNRRSRTGRSTGVGVNRRRLRRVRIHSR